MTQLTKDIQIRWKEAFMSNKTKSNSSKSLDDRVDIHLISIKSMKRSVEIVYL